MTARHRLAGPLWLLALTLYILAGVHLVPFHGDESTLIYMSRDFYYQFVQGDLEQVTYSDPPLNAAEQHLRLLNGTVAKYLFGLAAYSGGYGIDDINEQWDWGADWDYNQSSGRIPAQDLLLRARVVSALLLAGGAAAVFAIGWLLGGPYTAYLASLFYTLSPPLLLNGRRAMMEGALLGPALLMLLAGLLLLGRPRWWAFTLLGLAAGLAVAGKHSAVLMVAPVFAGCALAFALRPLPAAERLRPLAGLVGAGLLALLVFYALNPAWWGDPPGRVGHVLALRNELLAGQVAFFGGYTNLAEQLGGFGRQSLIALPQYYEAENWAAFISQQITDYEASPLRGVSLGGSLPGAALWLLLVLAGAAVLLRARKAPHLLALFWAAVVALSTLLLTPLEWQRYYLPVYPALCLLAALGISTALHALRRSRVQE